MDSQKVGRLVAKPVSVRATAPGTLSKGVICMIYAVDGVPFPKPPDMSSIQYTDSQIVTDAQRTVGRVLT